jgi:hypothetical protein
LKISRTASSRLPSRTPWPRGPPALVHRGIREKLENAHLDFEHHFGISTVAAKRYLRELDGKIEFIGTGAAGYYVLIPQNRG